MRTERKTTNFQGLTSLQRGGAFLRDFHLCNQHLKRRRIIPSDSDSRICTEAAAIAITRKVSEEEATFAAETYGLK
jgi:hypothetical protein